MIFNYDLIKVRAFAIQLTSDFSCERVAHKRYDIYEQLLSYRFFDKS